MSVDLVCFSHLRWNFVYQRPQHLMSRFARGQRVFFIEEPVNGPEPGWQEINEDVSGVWRVVPQLPAGLASSERNNLLRGLIDAFFLEQGIHDPILWYYSPMFLGFTSHLASRLVIYDCMDELSAFKGAAPEMKAQEAELLRRAELVFTGGQSLYEAKKATHPQVHCFPSSIDFKHFSQARTWKEEPADQQSIPGPRLGFFGVIDERMDLELLAAVAEARPDWHLVMLGPVVKIDPACLPKHANIHYLGMKAYKELPAYLAGWDVALLPFALNESTRFISPTKTPEYLAGGKPVVSTPITDVVRPYGERGLIRVAATPAEFVSAIEASLQPAAHGTAWLRQVDRFLGKSSWDNTWQSMHKLIDTAQLARLPMRGIRRATRRNRVTAKSAVEVHRTAATHNDQPLPIT